MIHVCFGLHDATGRYAKFTGTAMLSLFDNTNSDVTVHILHDNTLTQDNRDKFAYIAGRYGQRVKFYNVETLCADKIAEMVSLVPAVKNSRVSVGAFYRLLIPQLLPPEIKKAIYLDSDMLVNLDIAELWRIELGDKPLAAVPEIIASPQQHKRYSQGIIKAGFVTFEDYFNSGVLVMNLSRLRVAEELIMSGVKWRGEHPECWCFDQDIWNYLFAKNYIKLSATFDIFVRDARVRNENYILQAIYHYADSDNGKGYGLDTRDAFNNLWLSYFARTPWFNAETIGRLYAGFQQIHVSLKQAMINVSAIMSGKTRTFLTFPANLEATRELFAVKADEKIILADDQYTLQKLLDAMKKARGKKVFFIMLPGFPYQVLMEAGFLPGKDFVDGMGFLSEEQGVPLNSHHLLKAM